MEAPGGSDAAFDEAERSRVHRIIDKTIAYMEVARPRYESCMDELPALIMDNGLLIAAEDLSRRFDKDKGPVIKNHIVRLSPSLETWH